jgi:hypothetical protein
MGDVGDGLVGCMVGLGGLGGGLVDFMVRLRLGISDRRNRPVCLDCGSLIGGR